MVDVGGNLFTSSPFVFARLASGEGLLPAPAWPSGFTRLRDAQREPAEAPSALRAGVTIFTPVRVSSSRPGTTARP